MAASNEDEKTGQGRPRKTPLQALEVTVVRDKLAESASSDHQAPPIFCLSVPNRLLKLWRTQASSPQDYIPLLNKAVVSEAVFVKTDCDDVARR